MDEFDLDVMLQRALDRLALLAEASEVLVSTLDADEGLRRVCRILVPQLADWCSVELLGDDGRVRRAATAHRRPAAASARLREGPVPPPPPDAGGPLARALRGAGPLLVGGRGGAAPTPGGCTGGAWEGELLGAEEAASAIVAPLRARRRVLGALTVARTAGGPVLGADEAALVEDLAHRIALAVDNARLHAEVQRTAEQFQHALLPGLPDVAPVELAARYRPARVGAAEVGGDWYDAFRLPGDGTALIIGDVTGHDVRAAVAMSQLRNMLRGIACDRTEPPGMILRRLDLAHHALSDTTATCLYGILRPLPDGRWQLSHASAGHPPPLLATGRGDTCYLDEGRGLMLGVDPHGARPSATAVLTAGCTLLLYTDGLVERRGEDLETGFTRLRHHTAALARRPLAELCDELLAGLLGDHHPDDTALLALRLPPATQG
ncbi:SpoIIE family protein phosphatase [Streptacidiphilus sp. ASG 303]|uniref:PP2C family protein-serine/threonine phosphatase n=1 Tax=Streptacidiphilus sp. ASG 303 TaxID=2896847 RepID=UPI001E410601|nr:GAF domain-containing SpoIIE family protein phosphatase [Streptacidiphilus sp. ASG 303]MCD0484144.1 SpoIIE family protein phosphatase [Streptacidiphilus sp. ASG 303]